MRLGPDGIKRRIKRAGDKYVDGEIDEEELEEQIERALRMEYSYEELMMCEELMPASAPQELGMVLGKEIEPGGSVCFDDIFDYDPVEYDFCPY